MLGGVVAPGNKVFPGVLFKKCRMPAYTKPLPDVELVGARLAGEGDFKDAFAGKLGSYK
jgi:hypothetical protein